MKFDVALDLSFEVVAEARGHMATRARARTRPYEQKTCVTKKRVRLTAIKLLVCLVVRSTVEDL